MGINLVQNLSSPILQLIHDTEKQNSACHLTVAKERSSIMYELVEVRKDDVFTNSKVIAEERTINIMQYSNL